MNWRGIAEFAGFQIVWLASAIGAAHGSSSPGATAAAIFLLLQLMMGGKRRLAVSAAAASIAGSTLETLFAWSGLVTYGAPWPGPGRAPLWIMTLWLAYGTTVPTMSRLLGPKPEWKAAVLGAVFGPLAYIAGARIGALTLSEPIIWTCVALSLAWAIALPLLVAIDSRVARRG